MKVKLYKKSEDGGITLLTVNYDLFPSVETYNQTIDEYYDMGYHDTVESAQQS